MARLSDLGFRARQTARHAWQFVLGSPAVVLAGLLGLVLALSLVLYAGYGSSRVRRVLFFPDPSTRLLVGEEHYIPRSRGREAGARDLVEELLLGPADYELSLLVPRSVSLRSLVVRDRIAFVDLSADLVIDLKTVPLELGGVLQGMANNLYFNFPRLRGVYVLVHGQVPRIEGVDTIALAYAREMVR